MDIKQEKISDNSTVKANSNQMEILKKNFPNCFDKNGAFIPHKMEEIVGANGLDLSKESYSLNWLGKSYARLLANENPLTLLKEDAEHNSKKENKNSENLLIKGDNLEVLKHLKNAYESQIKMIYIDPPYNTGGDGFVYNDDRKFDMEELSDLAGVSLDEANRILEFTSSKSNSHSAWLTFMYPRLYIARELLKDDGVIFISIDDNEVSQLKLLCDEVFGEENFVGELARRVKSSGKTTDKIAINHDYLLIYEKVNTKFNQNEHDFKGYDLKDEYFESRGYYKLNQTLDYDSLSYSQSLDYPIEKDGLVLYPGGDKSIWEERQKGNHNRADWAWRWNKKLFEFAYDNGFVVIKDGKDRKRIYTKTYQKVRINNKTLKIETFERGKSLTTIEFVNKEYSNDNATKEIKSIFGKSYFDYAKPTTLIKKLIEINTCKDAIILDFFAGSGTTAHSVMDLNTFDNGRRKFITVQIPELLKEKSDAYRDGYKTIFDITKTRIEKVSKKLKSEKSILNNNLDLGFKIFETAPIFEGYLEDEKELDGQTIMFDGSSLSIDDLSSLLTTWKAYDGMKLTDELAEITFDKYKAYYGDKKLYFLDKGFTTNDKKAFLELLDSDDSFEPNKLVLWGYNFESKHQKELKEALETYSNKKDIEIDMIVRY